MKYKYKSIILFFGFLLVFFILTSNSKSENEPSPSSTIKRGGIKLKATGDGDNIVLVTTGDGDIKKASNIAKLDAVELRIDKICNQAGTACINLNKDGSGVVSINSRTGNSWNIQNDDNVVHYKAGSSTGFWSPIGQITDNASFVRKDTKYEVKNLSVAGCLGFYNNGAYAATCGEATKIGLSGPY